MGFIKKWKKKRKDAAKLERMKTKIEKEKLKMRLESLRNKKKLSKWQQLEEEQDAMRDFAQRCAEEYQAGGWQQLLKDPNVQEMIKAFLPSLLKSKDKGDVKGLLNQIPPEAKAQILAALAKGGK